MKDIELNLIKLEWNVYPFRINLAKWKLKWKEFNLSHNLEMEFTLFDSILKYIDVQMGINWNII